VVIVDNEALVVHPFVDIVFVVPFDRNAVFVADYELLVVEVLLVGRLVEAFLIFTFNH
jgi:hypothetical protein